MRPFGAIKGIKMKRIVKIPKTHYFGPPGPTRKT